MKSNLSTIFFLLIIVLLASCSSTKNSTAKNTPTIKNTSIKTKPVQNTSTANVPNRPTISGKAKVFTKPLQIDRTEFVAYARTFIGTPYKYGGINPATGLDCSGYIMVVFNHFNVKPPRVSKDYTNEGETITLKQAKAGDIILFTGSDNSSGIVGHMGIISSNDNGITYFLNSASGKNIGVIDSKLTGYWVTHFVKVIRILE